MRGVMPPAERPAVESRVKEVEDSTRAVDQSNRQLKEQVSTLRSASREASSAASRASSEVTRLTIQKSATEAELLNLQTIMKDVGDRNKTLEASVVDLQARVVEQEELIVVLDEKVTETRTAVVQKAEENFQLRAALAQANNEIAEGNGHIALAQHNEARAVALAELKDKKIESLLVYRKIVWISGAVLVLGIVAYFLLPIIIRSFKPL
jgi:chromosome segregation ATPase